MGLLAALLHSMVPLRSAAVRYAGVVTHDVGTPTWANGLEVPNLGGVEYLSRFPSPAPLPSKFDIMSLSRINQLIGERIKLWPIVMP
jgi:hypothetical protein